MSLLSYSEAVPWANAVKMQVLNDDMPPWLPEDGVGSFRHTRSLTAEEIDIIIDWVIGQTPEGEPLNAAELEMDPLPEWAMGGAPDLVLQPDEAVVLGEDDYEVVRCVVLPTGLETSRVVSELEVQPDLATVLRRATISLGETCEASRPLATWLPGQGSVALPGETGQQLPAGASLAVEYLYVKGWEDEGKRLTDRSRIGLRFSDSARAVEALHVSAQSHTFTEPVDLVALFPDSTLEEPLRIEVARPDGTVQPLLVIERVTAAWKEKYRLTEPMSLPAGTELRLSQPAVWIDFVAGSAPAGQ